MKVCVGITTKNRKDILPKAIDSALRQDYEDIEVFVLDDGSTDGTSALKEKYSNVRWERSEKSIGLLEGRNKMMRECKADIFISLDDDAWFMRNDEISVAVDYFRKNEHLGAIAFDILERDSRRFNEVPRGKPVATNIFIGCGHALRLSVVDKVGYYVPFPVKYGHEEKDLGIRMLNEGYDIWMLPGVHVWHDYTPVERNKPAQDKGFMINDLVYKYRRVPLLYLLPVLGWSIYRTMRNRVRAGANGHKAVFEFFKLIPSQSKYVNRVKIRTYRSYRKLSISYLEYRFINK